MNKIRIIKRDQQYSCFRVSIVCCNCNKILISKNFSWEKDHIGFGDNTLIKATMMRNLMQEEFNYCPKCGKTILKEDKDE